MEPAASASNPAGIPESLTRRWSWGGFLLPLLWPYWNAGPKLKWVTTAAWILSLYTFGVPALALAIYYGLRGNAIAARDRTFAGPAQFAAVQRAWATGGIIELCLSLPAAIVAYFLAMLVAAMFGGEGYGR